VQAAWEAAARLSAPKSCRGDPAAAGRG